ncbi:MAG: acylphosphatase [Afipia felis]|nr:acylphosphatase [Afipia felis]
MQNVINRVCIAGDVKNVDFEAFLEFYVKRLDLRRVAIASREDCIEIDLQGPPELVDMLIIACWLGPPRAAVSDVSLSQF